MTRHTLVKHVTLTLLLLAAGSEAYAQKYPERSHIRKGNRAFAKESYNESEVDYLRALEKDEESFEAAFNLGGSMYKQERFEEAASYWQGLVEKAPTDKDKAHVFYNVGNALARSEKYKEALEAYKNSMRLNPGDRQAQYNAAYVKKLIKDQEDQDENQDQNQDQNQPQNQPQGGQDNQPQDQDPNQNQDPSQDQQQNQPPPGMSQDDMEKMLDAVQENEDKTRENMQREKGQSVGRSGKNW